MTVIITADERARMLANGARSAAGDDIDPAPVVKLFTPDASATWLLTELDPDEPDIAFGLCDLGLGSPELGSVRLSEISAVRGPLRLAVERDILFETRTSLSTWAEVASGTGSLRAAERIIARFEREGR
jgi:hypothetical protein